MTLFSAPNDPWSHRTRIVLAEKGISIDIVSVEPGKLPEDLLDLNPYHTVPTLVDRDLVLYDSRVIIEYLDERFPHPPILRDTILQSTDLFKIKPFFLSDEFSLVDATIAPILWRLPFFEVDLPPTAQPIVKYASLIFSRPAFRESLSDAEQEMRLI
jgi:RNA polymerase-associated protein